MSNGLLHRQASLLEYLTSRAAIFLTRSDNLPTLPAGPFDIDAGLLHLEARYSHDKRMAKIKWVLQLTFEALGSERERMIGDFTEACPPTGIGRLENARQFRDFLKVCGDRGVCDPPYLPDLASFELAYAVVQGEIDETGGSPQSVPHARSGAIRRSPRAILLRCAYDIRPILEAGVGAGDIPQAERCFALSMPQDTREPVILAPSGPLFAVLEKLDDFMDPQAIEEMLGGSELIEEFVAIGLLERSP